MPWSAEPTGYGYWFENFIHPGSTGRTRSRSKTWAFEDQDTISCAWTSTVVPGLSGYDECRIGGPGWFDLQAPPDLPETGEYFTVLIHAPDDTPSSLLPPSGACSNAYNDIRKVVGGCPDGPQGIPFQLCLLSHETRHSDGSIPSGGSIAFPEAGSSVYDWTSANAIYGAVGPGQPGWAVNPDPLVDDPNVNASDPATILLWTREQLQATDIGLHVPTLNGRIKFGTFSYALTVLTWRLLPPVQPVASGAIAMVV